MGEVRSKALEVRSKARARTLEESVLGMLRNLQEGMQSMDGRVKTLEEEKVQSTVWQF